MVVNRPTLSTSPLCLAWDLSQPGHQKLLFNYSLLNIFYFLFFIFLIKFFLFLFILKINFKYFFLQSLERLKTKDGPGWESKLDGRDQFKESIKRISGLTMLTVKLTFKSGSHHP